MNPTVLAIPLPDNATHLAVRLAEILRNLIGVIALRFVRTNRAALVLPLCLYLQRTGKRLVRAVARSAVPAKPRKPRPGRPSGGNRLRLPATYGWLLRDLRHEAAVWRNQLEALLETDEAKTFLAATPTAGRLLRPLCHMLALRPAVLRRPRRNPASQAAPPPAREARAAPEPAAPSPPHPAFALPEPPCPRLRLRWPWAFPPAARPA
jgi:hypothetical protein